MTVHDLWYSDDEDPETGKRARTKRCGRGKRWRVTWEDPATRKVKTKAFDRQADAKTFDENISADINRGQYIDPKAGHQDIGPLFDEWIKSLTYRHATLKRMNASARLHFLPMFETRPIGPVRRSHIQSWVKDRSKILSPSSLSVVYSTVVAPFFKAMDLDEVIARTPCTGIKLPKIPPGEYCIAKPNQIHALADALPARFRAVPYLVSGCGWRSAEVFGSERSAFNFLRREAHVVQQRVAHRTGSMPVLGPPKTDQSKRTNELGRIALEELARHFEKFPSEPVEVIDANDPRNEFQRPAELTFTSATGLAVSAGNWSQYWRSAVGEAGLPAGFGLRDLRHYFATALIWGGANVKSVQLALGHANPMITLNTYTGYWPDAADTTRGLIDASFEQADDDDETATGS